MATHKSAEKRARQNKKRYLRNRSIKSAMKTTVKKLLTVLEAKEKEPVPAVLKNAISSINQAASKGVIHKRTASRKVSRLTKMVNKQQMA